MFDVFAPPTESCFCFEGRARFVPLFLCHLSCVFTELCRSGAGVSFHSFTVRAASRRSRGWGRRRNWKPLQSFRWSRELSVDYRVVVGFFAGWKEPPGAARTGNIQGTSRAHPLGAEVGGRADGIAAGSVPSWWKSGWPDRWVTRVEVSPVSHDDLGVFPPEETAAQWQISSVRGDSADRSCGRLPWDGCCKSMGQWQQ